MNLYRIKHVPSGRYLVDSYFGGGSGDDWPDPRFWGKSGAFWLKPQTIMKHLERLSYDWTMGFNERPYYFTGMVRGAHHPERLNDLAVEIIAVTVDSTVTVAAAEFSAQRAKEEDNA